MIITCGVPQGSILGPLLFLIYVNDLYKFSNILNTTLFADDTNLFYSHEDINILFLTVNKELDNLTQWFKANKLSLNITKTKYTLFHRVHKKENIPLKLPNLCIDKNIIKREISLKFLGVILDENVTWREHISVIENKVSKNIGILYKAKEFLNQSCLKYIYFSFIHCYLNYANIAWCSTNVTKLSKLLCKQKHAIRIITNENRFSHSKILFSKLNILNVYKLNLYHVLIFMFKLDKKMAPYLFNSLFKKINHIYSTRFLNNNYTQSKTYYSATKYSITLSSKYSKTLSSLNQFKTKLKQNLLLNDNELNFF